MKIIECPRDAMQGIDEFIPTEKKVNYINSLLKVGYDTIDVGSFVSPKAIPQMRDAAEVLKKIDLTNVGTILFRFPVFHFRNIPEKKYQFHHCGILNQGGRNTKRMYPA
jgi:hypothetical protein